jgi:hypothetical protein
MTVPTKGSLDNANFIFGTYESYALRRYAPDGGAEYEPDVWRGTIVLDGFGGISFVTEDAGGAVTSRTYRIRGNARTGATGELVCESGGEAAAKTLTLAIYGIVTLDPDANAYVNELATKFPEDEPYLRVYRKVE